MRQFQVQPKILVIISSVLLVLGLFQNCGGDVKFSDSSSNGKLGVCEGISCDLDPLTDVPAVTTILIALGDEANSQLVVNGASSQLIAETVIRYTSPKKDPKVLMVLDRAHAGESPEDTENMKAEMLSRYYADFVLEPVGGLTPSDLVGYDIVWFNNPGHAMGSQVTRDTLLGFAGGVVLQGDDLSQGNGFSLEPLTGLVYVNNGTSVTCSDGKSYNHDNNNGEQYRVRLNPAKIPGADSSTIEFRYGNDIDLTTLSSVQPNIEVLATAQGGPEVCNEDRPAIVRYLKEK